MIAAIYARKSTEQHVSDDAKSVVRQIENAKAFAIKKGWTVNESHIFVDDGISGAEFKRRPDFQRLLRAVESKSPFQVLIVSEQKSIGREASETGYIIKQLALAGVEIFEYGHGKSLTPRNALDKVISQVQGFADESQREQTSERVHEAHLYKAKNGYCVGGRVFGYRNKDVFNGEDEHGRPKRSHVNRVIDPAEAVVVRKIFALYDSGEGLKRIAILLNSERAVCPKPFVRKDPTKVRPVAGWSPGTVRAILRRELYRGVVVWNKSRKRTSWGNVKQQPRPESEWLRADAPHLRIIDEALWKRVQSRQQESATLALRLAGGRLSGRPPKTPTQNLLAGLATCALCGGGLVVETSPKKRGPRVPEYLCFRHRTQGTCTNALRMPVADLNESVLDAVEEHALTPEAIEQVIHLSERDDVTELQDKLVREQKDIAKRIARLVAAIESGADAVSVVAKLRELEARQRAIPAEIASLRPVPRLAPAVIENRLAEWRRLLRASTTQGRTVLQRILCGRLVFTPRVNPFTGEIDGYDFTGPTRFDKLFTGIAVERPKGVDEGPLGSEGITAEDTYDGDFGRLLARAHEKTRVEVLASPPGIEPGSRP